MHQGLAWALEHDPDTALRLGLALAAWWSLRSRYAAGYQLLAAAAGHAPEGEQEWCATQFWLGRLASDAAVALGHYTASRDALAEHGPSPLLVRALNGRAGLLANRGDVREAAGDVGRALTLARELGYPAGETSALHHLEAIAHYSGDREKCLAWARQAERIDPATIPGKTVRQRSIDLAVALIGTGEHAEGSGIARMPWPWPARRATWPVNPNASSS